MVRVSLAEFAPSYVRAATASAAISFGSTSKGCLHIPLRLLGGDASIEQWPSIDDVMFGSISVDETKPIEELTREVYARMFDEIRAAGFPHLLRIWNHLGALNEYERGLERYQLFSAGRHDAFVAAGYLEFPAACAIGMQQRGMIVYYLASREPGTQVENPRQVSAYRYPPQYGPKSPSFARATIWRDTMFISGTASVVGHETLHAGDVDAQLDETLRNLAALVPLENVIAAKTYIRHASDYERIARKLENVFASNLYLEADICRADLLLEIEAVARVNGGTPPSSTAEQAASRRL